MTDPFHVYRPLLDLIGRSEGTDRGRGYNETLAYGAYTGGDVDLTSMTLDQIDALQTRMLAHPENRFNSSALGRYQIVRTTLRVLRSQLELHGYSLFDARLQDKLAVHLLRRRGVDGYLSNGQGLLDTMDSLAKEWASLPNRNGKGHYDGQRAAVPKSDVVAALQECYRRFSTSGDAATADPPRLIGDKATLGGAAAGAVAVGTTGALADPDKMASYIVLGVVVAVFAIALILMKRKGGGE